MKLSKKMWYRILTFIALPAVIFLYFNQSANWHYHVTEDGFIVQHAHPFSNSMIPGTPFQDHEHSDAEYLFLAEMMHSLGMAFVIILLLGLILHPKRTKTFLPLPAFLTNNGSEPVIPRGPPATIGS